MLQRGHHVQLRCAAEPLLCRSADLTSSPAVLQSPCSKVVLFAYDDCMEAVQVNKMDDRLPDAHTRRCGADPAVRPHCGAEPLL